MILSLLERCQGIPAAGGILEESTGNGEASVCVCVFYRLRMTVFDIVRTKNTDCVDSQLFISAIQPLSYHFFGKVDKNLHLFLVPMLSLV